MGSEAPIVPRSYTPAKYLPMVAQPDLSISEQDDEGSYDNPSPSDEGSGSYFNHCFEMLLTE